MEASSTHRKMRSQPHQRVRRHAVDRDRFTLPDALRDAGGPARRLTEDMERVFGRDIASSRERRRSRRP